MKKKKISVYYAKIENMGDLLNKEIIEKIYNCKVVRRNFLVGSISGIGSGLANYFYDKKVIRNIAKLIFGKIYPKTYIWGTGFIDYSSYIGKLCKSKTEFCAVRGELSKNRIEKIINKKLNITTGDAGILASYLLDKRPNKKFSVGIIPHITEQHDKKFDELKDKFSNSIIIDVSESPMKVTKQIAECDYIISSSLHGLIIADSLEIPNIHVTVTNNLLGDGFKFDDYYSAYGLEHNCIDMNKSSIDSLEFIESNYKLTHEVIEKKKKEMIQCFPYKEMGLIINQEVL